MKKHILFFLLTVISVAAIAQADSIQPPYKKFPTYPPVKLLLPDSVTYYTKTDLPKKTPVMLMLFNPQCEHCQHETEEIIKNIGKFKDIQIVMSTSMPFDSMRAFREKYKLAQYDNIIMGHDTYYFLPTFYMIRNMPFLAFYNKKKELISIFEGALPIDRILAVLKD